jgi:hypothetical protein
MLLILYRKLSLFFVSVLLQFVHSSHKNSNEKILVFVNIIWSFLENEAEASINHHHCLGLSYFKLEKKTLLGRRMIFFDRCFAAKADQKI